MFDAYEIRRGHQRDSGPLRGVRKPGARHFSQPKMPKMPQQTTPPPDRSDADKEAGRRIAEQRQATGRRSTLIAGAGTPETLGKTGTLGGSNTMLGGGATA